MFFYNYVILNSGQRSIKCSRSVSYNWCLFHT